MIDHKNLYRPFLRLELQPKLLLQRLAKGAARFVAIHFARVFRCPFEGEIISAFKRGPFNDRPRLLGIKSRIAK